MNSTRHLIAPLEAALDASGSVITSLAELNRRVPGLCLDLLVADAHEVDGLIFMLRECELDGDSGSEKFFRIMRSVLTQAKGLTRDLADLLRDHGGLPLVLACEDACDCALALSEAVALMV